MFSRVTVVRGVASYLLGFVMIGVASANAASAPAGVDPASFDVAGVKLGMTRDEAIEALKKFDNSYDVVPQYMNGRASSYSAYYMIVAKKPIDPSYFVALWARTPKPDNADYFPTGRDKGAYEEVHVVFAPTPGSERVIAVTRHKQFGDAPPTVANLKAHLVSKYNVGPMTHSSSPINIGNYGDVEVNGHCDATTFDYIFDAQKRLMPGKKADSRGNYAINWNLDCSQLSLGDGLPDSAAAGDGIGMSAVIENDDGHSAARVMGVSIFDASALYKSVGQSKSTIDALEARAKAAEAAKAAQAPQNLPKL